MSPRVVVVGGGPAGMMAAIAAADQGAHVTLLEKNEKLGKKLYITGKGRCNLCNACQAETFFSNVMRNPKFLSSAWHGMDSSRLIAFFEELGLPLVVERGNRVFPVSQKSSDVIRTLHRALADRLVKVQLSTGVQSLVTENSQVRGVLLHDGSAFPCDSVVLACGGKSYSSTGSTGDGYRLAQSIGHNVLPPRAALVPINLKGDWFQCLQGLSLKNVRLCATHRKKTLMDEVGEMLFAHWGITGPLVLTLSSVLEENTLPETQIFIDFKPGLTDEMLNARLLRDFDANRQKLIGSVLGEMLPKSLVPIVAQRAGIELHKPVHQVTRNERETLVSVMKRFSLEIDSFRSLEEAVVTRGGVDVKEVNPQTMESKLMRNCFFAGEMLDVDALTGGFNLQIAFSTGFSAGRSAGQCENQTNG